MSGEFDPRITAYFGDAVLRAGFMPTPHLFLRHYAQLGLDSTHAMFLLQIMETAWDFGDPPKTSSDFARRMGVGKKAIQRYTSHVEELGLINVFSQFDDSGAQVENCYDLSPLFAKLAQFAPEPTPGGSLRRQQRRTGALAAATASTATSVRDVSASPGQNDPVPPGQISTRPPGHIRPGEPDQFVAPRSDSYVQGAGSRRSGLKAEQRILKKQQEQMLLNEHSSSTRAQSDTAQSTRSVTTEHEPPLPGWALRWQHALSAADVARSVELLRRMQIDNPVRTLLASAYTPADIWALRVYSLSKGWSPALTVSQSYDKLRKLPMLAVELASQHDDVGRQLAALEPETAEAVIELVFRCCPQAERLRAEPLWVTADSALAATIAAVWQMVAELRGLAASALTLSTASQPAPPPDQADGVVGALWQATLTQLQNRLPAIEFATWIAPSMLLSLEQHADAAHAIIGVPHIFAREQITSGYLTSLSQALAQVLGKPVTVQIEIDATLCVPQPIVAPPQPRPIVSHNAPLQHARR